MRETITGVAKGITEDGVLLLEDHEGKVHHIHSADIELKEVPLWNFFLFTY